MYIVCRDTLGIVITEVDGTVLFFEGKACFTSDGKNMEVPIKNIVEIGGE